MKCCFINKLFDYENIIRGGIARSIYYFAEANNKYMDDYDESKVSSRIMYFDFNNQYRWALSESLPCKANKMNMHQLWHLTISLTMAKTVNLVIQYTQ